MRAMAPVAATRWIVRRTSGQPWGIRPLGLEQSSVWEASLIDGVSPGRQRGRLSELDGRARMACWPASYRHRQGGCELASGTMPILACRPPQVQTSAPGPRLSSRASRGPRTRVLRAGCAAPGLALAVPRSLSTRGLGESRPAQRARLASHGSKARAGRWLPQPHQSRRRARGRSAERAGARAGAPAAGASMQRRRASLHHRV